MKNFLRKYIWLFLIVALAILFPQSLSNQASLNMRMIIAGIGIDYINDKYNVTAEVILPSKSERGNGINAKVEFVSELADTVGAGVNAVSKKFGKIAELSHLEYVLIGDGFENKNIGGELDYFFRNFKLKNSIMLLACDGKSAKDTIKNIGGLDMGVALSMQKVYVANQENLNSIAKTYVDFVRDSLSASGISVLDTLAFEEIQSEQNQSGEQEKENQKQAQMKILSPLKICKNGVFVGTIEDKNDVFAYYLYNQKSKSGNYQIENFSYGDTLNANINIRIDELTKQKIVNFDSSFPTIKLKLHFAEAHIDEIASKTLNSKLFSSYLDKDLQQAIIEKASADIKAQMHHLFDTCKANNIDIFELARECNSRENAKWQKYLSELKDRKNYLENCSFDVEVVFDKIR